MLYYKEMRRHANIFLYLELASAASSLTFKPDNNNKNNNNKRKKEFDPDNYSCTTFFFKDFKNFKQFFLWGGGQGGTQFTTNCRVIENSHTLWNAFVNVQLLILGDPVTPRAFS